MFRLSVSSLLLICITVARAADLPSFDFTKEDQCKEWKAQHDISNLDPKSDGLSIKITGDDPYLVGPARDYPEGEMLWMFVHLKSEQGGVCQIFYFTQTATEDASVRFEVAPGVMSEHRVALPPLGKGYRLRIDPPGSGGESILASIRFQPRPSFKMADFKGSPPNPVGKDALSINSGPLKLLHDPNALGAFELRVDGENMARGFSRGKICYVAGDLPHWIDCSEAHVSAKKENGALHITAVLKDLGGAQWDLQYRFSPRKEGAIDVEVQVGVSENRDVLFLPLLVMHPGAGNFGPEKNQALFAGVEYLENEPSSSEKDMRGPISRRQIPDPLKITFPLMAIQAEDRYVGLIWEQGEEISAFFDSPDRTFHSGSHAMGLLFPGATAAIRKESDLLPHTPVTLAAGKSLLCRATIIGGSATTVIPAVQKYVQLKDLPAVPTQGVAFEEYVATATCGWLDSKCREGEKYRHAVWQGFGAGPAADAAIYMDWLARQTHDKEAAARLRAASKEAVLAVKPSDWNTSGISHVRHPLGSLIYGSVNENAEAAARRGKSLLAAFEKDGARLYKKPANNDDMAATHFGPEANGYTALPLLQILEDASVSGDPELKRQALRLLDAMGKFDNGVPRGAQTWEIPLHTPDIYASALLIRTYMLGYSVSGEEKYLERAKYWAWTGVPFVYLRNPTAGRAGPYATIAVLGATHWQSPNWLGNPVQWCGLVYADALRTLAKHDKDKHAPWTQIADGITATGIQFSWPLSDKNRQGLLPDFYHLREQFSDGPAINPGTLQSSAVELFTKVPLYDLHGFPKTGAIVHAPGEISDAKEKSNQIEFKVKSWLADTETYYVLMSGLKKPQRVRINKGDLAAADYQFVENGGRLILRCSGPSAVEISWDK